MLELRNVCKRFLAVTAVDNVSFSARPGEVTGYLGPNASGKSTTMKMITGLMETTSGKILFGGKAIEDNLVAYKQLMGYVPEEPHLYSHLSGWEYLVMVGQLRNLPAKMTADCIDGLLRLFSLHGDRHAPISAYSKGMRQKVLISAALLHNPDLLLLDEPFSSLDNPLRLEMRRCLARVIREEIRVPTILVTHDILEAYTLAERVLIYANGRVVQSGRPEMVFNNPVNDEVSSLVSLKNLYPGYIFT